MESLVCSLVIKFQSTLPRGSDDYASDFALYYLGISIHAPSRERPPVVPFMDNLYIISIHAPSRERLKIPDYYLKLFISIHAPSRERLVPLFFITRKQNFNPRSLAGATHY